MAATFEGFPRVLQRSALKPGRWFTAADGPRAVLCFATEVQDGDQPISLIFNTAAIETLEVAPAPMSVLGEHFGTVEDEIVFAPGQNENAPMLVAPVRRGFRHGSLLRLASGDLGIGVVLRGSGDPVIISLTTGEPAVAYDLIFERWSLWLRRGAAQTLLGYYKPHPFTDRRRG